ATGWGSHHATMPHHHFVRFHHFHHFVYFRHFHHFAHFRHRHVLFASAIGVGSCWRWGANRWGWDRGGGWGYLATGRLVGRPGGWGATRGYRALFIPRDTLGFMGTRCAAF